MNNLAILYFRLIRKIVRESACRLGGAEETFLASGFDDGDTAVRGGAAASPTASPTASLGRTRKRTAE